MIKFRIYPEWGKLYYEVFVYDTHKEMESHALKFKEWYPTGTENLKEAGAVTIPFTAYKQGKNNEPEGLMPLLGYILFCKETQFDEVVISHECLHALIFYVLRKGFNLEEVFLGNKSEELSQVTAKNKIPKKAKKRIPEEFLCEHERFCMAHSYMMEQITEKLKLWNTHKKTTKKTSTEK